MKPIISLLLCLFLSAQMAHAQAPTRQTTDEAYVLDTHLASLLDKEGYYYSGKAEYTYYEKQEDGDLFPKRVPHGAFHFQTDGVRISGQFVDGKKQGEWTINDIRVTFGKDEKLSCEVNDHFVINNKDRMMEGMTYSEQEVWRKFTIRDNQLVGDLDLRIVWRTMMPDGRGVERIEFDYGYQGQFTEAGWAHGRHSLTQLFPHSGDEYQFAYLYHHGFVINAQERNAISGEVRDLLTDHERDRAERLKRTFDPKTRKWDMTIAELVIADMPRSNVPKAISALNGLPGLGIVRSACEHSFSL